MVVFFLMIWGYIFFNVVVGYLYGFVFGFIVVIFFVLCGLLIVFIVCRWYLWDFVCLKLELDSLKVIMCVVEGKCGIKVIVLIWFILVFFGL